MASLYDLIRFYTNTQGIGTIAVGGAVPGYLTPAQAGIPNGTVIPYGVADGGGIKRAVGEGVYSAGTLTRDANEISASNGVLGGALSLSGVAAEVALSPLAKTFAEIAGGNQSGAVQQTFLQSGGQVIWVTGLQFLVSAAHYYISGVEYQSAQQTITLATADVTHPRIDVIGLDNTATVFKSTGTAAASPSEPVTDPGSQLKLALVTIAAGATEPTVANTVIYAENAGSPTEWTGSTSGTGFALNSTTDPRTGTTHVTATALGANAYAQWDKPTGTIDPLTQSFLVFYIKSTAAWANNRGLNVNLLSAGVVRGITIPINRTGSYGFDSNNLTLYQQIAIPLTHFAIPAGQTFNQVRFTRFGGAINFRMDDVSLQTGGASGGGGDFLTLAQAKALFGKRVLQVAVSDPNGSAITTGDGKAYARINEVLNGFNLVAVAAHVTTVSSSGAPTIQINNTTQNADMLTTKITIDANEKDSSTAAAAAVIDAGNDDVATGDELRIDIDVAGTGAKGLIVDLTFAAP